MIQQMHIVQAAESTRPAPACVEVTNALWLFSRHRAGEEWFTSKVMMMMMVMMMRLTIGHIMVHLKGDDDDDGDDDDADNCQHQLNAHFGIISTMPFV